MQYMLLIYADPAEAPRPGTPEFGCRLGEYRTFGEAAHTADVMRDSAPLQPVATATTVRVRNGATLTTDGPFAETKEQLGGYMVFECADLDAAISWAARIPGAVDGSIEVRPIMEF